MATFPSNHGLCWGWLLPPTTSLFCDGLIPATLQMGFVWPFLPTSHAARVVVEYINIANEDDAKLSDLSKKARMEEALEHFPELNNVIQLASLLIAQNPNYDKDYNKSLGFVLFCR